MRGPQLFAPSMLGLGEAETPITADKRLHGVYPALAGLRPNPALAGLLLSAILVRKFRTLYYQAGCHER